jgi:transposase
MAMMVVCGIDWSQQHHDVAVVDADGRLVAKRRIGDDAVGFGRLLELLAEAGDRPQAPIPVAIKTTRGLLVACLRATGRPV